MFYKLRRFFAGQKSFKIRIYPVLMSINAGSYRIYRFKATYKDILIIKIKQCFIKNPIVILRNNA